MIERKIENITFLGSVTQEIETYYKDADCFLLVSTKEGVPTSVLEAMACGLPIVCSNVGGLGKLIIDDENGYVIDDFCVDSYVKKISILKTWQTLYYNISSNNKNKADKYKWEAVADNVTSNMRQAIQVEN